MLKNSDNVKIKEGIKNTFDSAAKDYDSGYHFKVSAKKFTELINLKDKDEVNILDLSTGTGNLALQIAQKFPKAKLIGIDISNEMLNIARQKSKDLGIKNINYLNQDVENLEITDMRFDLVTCSYGMFFYPNMDRVLKDICTRLNDGGKFMFSTFTMSAFEPFSKKFLEILEKSYNIKPPQVLESRMLQSIEEIKEFCSLVEYKALDIKEISIEYKLHIDEVWKIFTSAGYKGLLNQLGDNYNSFEEKYLAYLKSISVEDRVDFNANSYVTTICI